MNASVSAFEIRVAHGRCVYCIYETRFTSGAKGSWSALRRQLDAVPLATRTIGEGREARDVCERHAIAGTWSLWYQTGEPVGMAADSLMLVAKERGRSRYREATGSELQRVMRANERARSGLVYDPITRSYRDRRRRRATRRRRR